MVKNDVINKKYDKLECILENALEWSGLSTVDASDFSTVKFNCQDNKNTYHWFGSKITFSTSLKCELFDFPHKEESTVVERLIVSIEADEKQDTSYFTAIRNKVISLISFAIKDNVNVDEQYLYDYDDSYRIGEHTEYYKHYLYTSEHRLSIHNNSRWEYNFTLAQLLPEKDIKRINFVRTHLQSIFVSIQVY